jgi:glutathione synthase/RimK-type ligase-like ATP-grasp enzyme
VTAVYTRLMDDRLLPELRREPEGSPRRRHCRLLHETLMRWCEVAPARVVNRAGPMASNFSKPYQAQLIVEHGLSVPETLITNDPRLVTAFQRRHGRVVYKSASGVRSIVRELEPGDTDRLERIRWCPTQFQQFVDGTHIRVHVIGDVLHATALDSDVVDYRYATRDGAEAPELRAVDLPDALAERCVALAAGLELPFAGIDLKLAESGEVYCFEVNPCPAFSYYELSTGQPIARTLARYLVDAA